MMKRLLTLFAALSMGGVVMAQAVIKFEKTNLDFGTFKESEVQTRKFVFTNTGDKPLVIQQAYGSCGCTVATPPKNPIQPGEKGTIMVSYDGRGKLPGFFKKVITVRSNASNSIYRIYIQGNMLTKEDKK